MRQAKSCFLILCESHRIGQRQPGTGLIRSQKLRDNTACHWISRISLKVNISLCPPQVDLNVDHESFAASCRSGINAIILRPLHSFDIAKKRSHLPIGLFFSRSLSAFILFFLQTINLALSTFHRFEVGRPFSFKTSSPAVRLSRCCLSQGVPR